MLLVAELSKLTKVFMVKPCIFCCTFSLAASKNILFEVLGPGWRTYLPALNYVGVYATDVIGKKSWEVMSSTFQRKCTEFCAMKFTDTVT